MATAAELGLQEGDVVITVHAQRPLGTGGLETVAAGTAGATHTAEVVEVVGFDQGTKHYPYPRTRVRPVGGDSASTRSVDGKFRQFYPVAKAQRRPRVGR